MQVFNLRQRLIHDYSDYVTSFIHVREPRLAAFVDEQLRSGVLWPEPLIQLNPSFEEGGSVDQLVADKTLHPECARVFRVNKAPDGTGQTLRLYRHQTEAILAARSGGNYVLTTGTGSGKSLAYIVPIVDYVLRSESRPGIKAIVVYPMNALANSQVGELEKFLCVGYPEGKPPVTFQRYTGQESDDQKKAIIENPPDILLTNYVMLELLLTRPKEKPIVQATNGLRFLVLDELHTYRGRQGSDVALLVRRCRETFGAPNLQCVGTSATLAGPGTYDEQRAEVARVASLLFGAPVEAQHVIGETLQRITPDRSQDDPDFIEALRRRINAGEAGAPQSFQDLARDPLSAWIESTFGIQRDPASGRLVRVQPRGLRGESGAGARLAELTGIDADTCASVIERHLLASYEHGKNPQTGFPVFAFRLHQFISRGDAAYASLESESDRYLTLQAQQFVPGDRTRILLPLVFCRECGQEYYCVRLGQEQESGRTLLRERDLSDRLETNEGVPGFLYFSTTDHWPDGGVAMLERLPDDWIEETKAGFRVKRDRQRNLPRAVHVSTDGTVGKEGIDVHFFPAPFRFCLRCGVAYGSRQSSDFGKLASLATEGRSTATTILALSAIRALRSDESLPERARKLLSFTDNRQDASLQAGHFNDFVEIGLLRSGVYRAVKAAGPEGLRHDEIVQKVFEALDLPVELYGLNADGLRFAALDETKRAFRSVLAYRLYRDLRRGWRVTSPNLEQCGLLRIEYLSLDDLCAAADVWEKFHPTLATASPDTRKRVAKTLLDLMRRGLAIKAEVLDTTRQEQIQQQSFQRLREPWAFDENEKLETAAILYPRSRRQGVDFAGNMYLSPRGGFGQYLRRDRTFPEWDGKLNVKDSELVIGQLLEALRVAGLVEIVDQPRDAALVPGFQLPASAILWAAGDGTRAFHDPILVPRLPEEGGRTNGFFVDYYGSIALSGKGLEAREHTAQVRYEDRMDREDRFREGKLPILFCSPTMELGVDIAQLNAVNMRNIPPTPANYAQRSGRAGRSGQPAIVFSYCSTYSSHDQYFFRRPGLMVAGSVTPPRLDLANEDLIRAHVHAIWLAESGLDLGKSLKEVLELGGEEPPRLGLLPGIQAGVDDPSARRRARTRAEAILASLRSEIEGADWYTDPWLDEVVGQVGLRFDEACDRWRSLYLAALKQRALQHAIIADHSRSNDDRNKAKRLRAEAEAQIELLTQGDHVIDSDFYSYRYFASEGFLPGYNFTRLPLSAYVPGRRTRTGRNEFISRARFLAINEFGPRAIIYHEGSRYRVNKVILAPERDAEGNEVTTRAAKRCSRCGYLHPITGVAGVDRCELCEAELDAPLANLFRMQNVATKRADRINSDEEERLRLGYNLRTAVRFNEHDGRRSMRVATVAIDTGELAKLTYGSAATIWRINLGWRHQADGRPPGFVLDIERGYWARQQEDPEDDQDDPLSRRTRRVIPFVEDRRNCLLIEPTDDLGSARMASLQAALKHAMQVEYQLEDSELAAEPLPTPDLRHLMLYYEASEGGAGVLRRLIDEPDALPRIARQALRLCHFDPDTGEDLRRAPTGREDCEAACYDCLRSYTNQIDHELLDRKSISELLLQLAAAKVKCSPAPLPRAQHLENLRRQSTTDLEREWLGFLEQRALRLPSHAQYFIEQCKTRPDFLYEDQNMAIYVDGPHHDFPERHQRDADQTECLEDAGYLVLRFGLRDDWEALVAKHPGVFGFSKR